jgi:hypothetical protein
VPSATESGKKPPELKLKKTTRIAGVVRSAAVAVRRIVDRAATSALRAHRASARASRTIASRRTTPSAPAVAIRP